MENGGVADLNYPTSKYRRGRVQESGGISPTLTTTGGLCRVEYNGFKIRIRKLTEVECFKLMGLTKDDCEKCKAVGVSNSQLYRQAGNGIVTNCIELLFEHLYKSQYNQNFVCFDEKMVCTD